MLQTKRALAINAAFSGISGVVLILFQTKIAAIFEIETVTIFWVIGVALVLFASTILYEIAKLNQFRIIWIVTQDMFWVLGSIYILIVNRFSISKIGNYIISIIAIIVLFIAISQSLALIKDRKRGNQN